MVARDGYILALAAYEDHLIESARFLMESEDTKPTQLAAFKILAENTANWNDNSLGTSMNSLVMAINDEGSQPVSKVARTQRVKKLVKLLTDKTYDKESIEDILNETTQEKV